ncbi:hypothetical protein EIP91_002704 [Steccherinum ochraceum]|uniref:Uncharacterized protein n=1 Tax=Steccherinum ochraceum TaxID=92696 RepID=A0A4R0RI06_9APHY|nr:hypothetical protein EIP91_002704 [Steccherinum ochraceum]
MGGASSKAARQFPKSGSIQTPRTSARPSMPEVRPDTKVNIPRASETRTAAIEEDAKDPHLAANLTRLGPVRVDHHMKTIQPMVDQVSRTFQSRLQSEQQATSSGSTRNRLVVSALTSLLDEKKASSRSGDLQSLADLYHIDLAQLQRIVRYVNSPSVDPESVVRTLNDDGTERTTMKAMWVD